MSLNYEYALKLAEEVKSILSPYTIRCEVAGGIRRKKQEPHDIEIVCVPVTVIENQGTDIFGNRVPVQIDILQDYLTHNDAIIPRSPDKAGKKSPFGPKYYRARFKQEKLDIFVVLPQAQFGTVFLIRTGDAEFSHKFVTRLWKFGLRSVDGHIESSVTKQILPTPEEIDCFKLCQLDWIEPEKRTASAIS